MMWVGGLAGGIWQSIYFLQNKTGQKVIFLDLWMVSVKDVREFAEMPLSFKRFWTIIGGGNKLGGPE